MSGHDPVPFEDRRGLDRRVEMLERDMRLLDSRTAVIEALMKGLVSTMESRHKAFERGQDLILERLGRLQAVKERMVGAFTLVSILGISGIVGGIIAIVKAVKGP